MKLVANWREIALRAHSMWAIYLGLIALFMSDVIFVTTGHDSNPRFFIWSSAALFAYGGLGRLIDQGGDAPQKRRTRRLSLLALLGVIVAIFLAACEDQRAAAPTDTAAPEMAAAPQPVAPDEFIELAVAHIGKWEGLRLEAYRDIGGIWTICYGETKGVREGDVRTNAECDAMFAPRIADFRDRLRPSFTAETIALRLPVERDVAFTSLAYNAGVGAISKSTAVRRLNAGDIPGACQAIGWWTKVGSRVIRGLVNRRVEEVALCMKGAEIA